MEELIVLDWLTIPRRLPSRVVACNGLLQQRKVRSISLDTMPGDIARSWKRTLTTLTLGQMGIFDLSSLLQIELNRLLYKLFLDIRRLYRMQTIQVLTNIQLINLHRIKHIMNLQLILGHIVRYCDFVPQAFTRSACEHAAQVVFDLRRLPQTLQREGIRVLPGSWIHHFVVVVHAKTAYHLRIAVSEVLVEDLTEDVSVDAIRGVAADFAVTLACSWKCVFCNIWL